MIKDNKNNEEIISEEKSEEIVTNEETINIIDENIIKEEDLSIESDKELSHNEVINNTLEDEDSQAKDEDEIVQNETSLNEEMQENNDLVKPTSSRQEVEVDKIFQLLKDAKDEIKNKSNQKKDRKERLDKIINEIPKKTPQKPMEQIEPEEIPHTESIDINKLEEKEVVLEESAGTKKSKSNGFNYILILIIIALGYLQYDNYIKSTVQNNANMPDQKVLVSETTIGSDKLKFNNLPNEIQEKYILKKEMINTQKHANLLIKKARLLTDEKKELEKQISTLKMQITSTDSNKANSNRDLLKKINLLKVEQAGYSNKIVNLRMNQKKSISLINQLTSRKEQLETEIKKLKETQPVVKTVIKTVIKEIPAKEDGTQSEIASNKYDKVVEKELFPAVISSSKEYKIIKCYDLPAGEFYLTPKCKRDIGKFVKENKKAKRFEIIGVVDSKDFSSFYNENTTTQNAKTLQKYNAMGLARYRVLETSWYLTEQLESKVALTPVNYTITSKKNNRGTLIRAYFK